jgi:hypothetical protein
MVEVTFFTGIEGANRGKTLLPLKGFADKDNDIIKLANRAALSPQSKLF